MKKRRNDFSSAVAIGALLSIGTLAWHSHAAARRLPPSAAEMFWCDDDGRDSEQSERARVLLVQRGRVGEREMPGRLDDLTDPRWRGQIAIANPLFGSTLLHIAALSLSWGEERVHQFLNALRDNDVRVTGSEDEIARLVASGDVAFGLVDAAVARRALKESADLRVVYPDQSDGGTFVAPACPSVSRAASQAGDASSRRVWTFDAARLLARVAELRARGWLRLWTGL